jgi:hypothetical protein
MNSIEWGDSFNKRLELVKEQFSNDYSGTIAAHQNGSKLDNFIMTAEPSKGQIILLKTEMSMNSQRVNF